MKPFQLAKSAIVCLLLSGIILPSCTKQDDVYQYPISQNPVKTPTVMNVHLTGASSTAEYSKVNVDLQSLEFNTSTEAGVTDGWEPVNMQLPGVVDILSLLHGKNVRLNADMLPGNVKQLRMRFGQNNSVEINGEAKALNVSTELRESGLIFYVNIDEANEYATSLWLSFDAGESISYDANSGEYSLLPSISTFDETTTGAIEGFVVPSDAKASIQIQGDVNSRNVLVNVTTLADENNQGYFKFVGVPEGTYQIEMIANDGTDRRKVISQVEVKMGAVVDLGSNELQ